MSAPFEHMRGRVALVTGAQQGIGAAIALALAEVGVRLVVNHLDDGKEMEALEARLAGAGGEWIPVRGSVTDPGDVGRMVGAGPERWGRLDIAVNNAGIFPRVAFLEMTESDWDRVMEVNLKGAFRVMQAAARAIIATSPREERRGSIVNLASSAAFRGSPRGAHYAASKAGLLGLTRQGALELASAGIRVNAVAPGLTDTAQPRHGMSEAEIAAAGAAVPLGRIGTPADVARLVRFLASDEAGHITGQTVHVNGGQVLT